MLLVDTCRSPDRRGSGGQAKLLNPLGAEGQPARRPLDRRPPLPKVIDPLTLRDMSNSSRFAVAVHALSVLALKQEPVTSTDLADSIGTNPAFVRHILMQLKAGGLVKARRGKAGGSFLGRAADRISLLDVYDAVRGSARLFARHKSTPSAQCVVGRHILPALDAATAPAQEALRGELAEASIADVLADITARDPAWAAEADR